MDDRHPESLTPPLLLAFWRERWGKSATKPAGIPYLQGQLDRWGEGFTHWAGWSLPAVAGLSAVACVTLFGLLLLVQFPLNGQLTFSVFIVGLALYAHRSAGTFVTLVLMGLTSLLLARYFYWRLSVTLAPEFGLDLVFGLVLCVAELHLWTLMMVGAIRAAWPVREPTKPLPVELGGWPSVDVLVLCHGRSLAAVQSTLIAVGALSWHPKKLKICVLDSGHREEVQAFSSAIGATYLTSADETCDELARINQALAITEGEVIAILDGDSEPNSNFLKTTIGWFLHDSQLGMLQTPGHFLAPKPAKRILDIFKSVGASAPYALVRRSMLNEASGVDANPALTQTHLALKLQELARSSSYLGFVETTEMPPDSKNTQTAPPSTPEAFRIFRPFGDTALLWKLRLAAFEAWLTFFRPLPYWVFFFAPVVYLLLDMRVIQTSAYLWLAYALPQFVLGLVIKDRKYREYRVPLWADIREVLLSWHLLILTPWTLVRTEVTKFSKILTNGNYTLRPPYAWRAALTPVVSFALSMTAVAVGTAHLLNPQAKTDELRVLFMCWALYNLAILLARLAVTEENREVRRYLQSQKHLPAMIRLPSGRTMSCTTENFPESVLRLKLPEAVTFASAVTTNLSIFHRHREFSFPVRVVPEHGSVVSAHIDGTALNVYKSLGVAAYSRGRDWPKWLPDRDADQPMPQWLVRTLAALGGPSGWFARSFSKFANAIRGVSWFHIGKKRK